jgi:hypothetical protein
MYTIQVSIVKSPLFATLSNMWDKFWVWVDAHYIYQTVVLVFITGFVLFKIFGITRFKFGRDGIEVERLGKDAVSKAILDKVKKLEDGFESLARRVDEIDGVLKSHYQFIRNAVVQSGIGVAWSDKGAPFDETVKAILMNISLGENGNHKDRLKEVIIGKGEGGVKDYRSKLNEFVKENKNRLDGHFYKVIDEIDREVR